MQARVWVDIAALRENIAVLRALAGKAQFLAVVKANAYGHGLDLVAPAIADIVDAYGVYEVGEAVRLRELNIQQPIHILGAVPPTELGEALNAQATLAIWDGGTWLRDLSTAARHAKRTAQVQLKIDSGLTRLGASPRSVPELFRTINQATDVRLVGAYSHLAAAEELDSRYTLDQLDRFLRAIPPGSVAQRHIAASAAAMLWPQTRLDLVRWGIAMYGVWPSPSTRERLATPLTLKPVLSWKSHIVALRHVEPETPIGYGCNYRPARATTIAIIPIGYAEGLPRSLSNHGSVLVGGQRCPIVSRVCMNMSFVDVGHVPQVYTGAPVTLIGSDGDCERTAEHLAEDAGTIAYELLARLPMQIPRAALA